MHKLLVLGRLCGIKPVILDSLAFFIWFIVSGNKLQKGKRDDLYNRLSFSHRQFSACRERQCPYRDLDGRAEWGAGFMEGGEKGEGGFPCVEADKGMAGLLF